jgi:hypothetical protein
MFECERCRGLGLNPACETCSSPASQAVPTDRDEELIVAVEVVDEPLSLDDDGADVVLKPHEEEGEVVVIDWLADDEEDVIIVVDWLEDEGDPRPDRDEEERGG